MNLIYIGVGSNIEPEKKIPHSLQILSQNVKIVSVSSLWHTMPVGTDGQPFLNAAILIGTNFDLDYLKEEILCSTEEKMGRIRTQDKNSPRPIDLDILIYNNSILDPQIFLLDHLIFPLSELLPELFDPSSGKTLFEIRQFRAASTEAFRVAKIEV
jgi:2-amino-4-hydroxy-6-hydroxymethyldihydropteridine diphosphokinase